MILINMFQVMRILLKNHDFNLIPFCCFYLCRYLYVFNNKLISPIELNHTNRASFSSFLGRFLLHSRRSLDIMIDLEIFMYRYQRKCQSRGFVRSRSYGGNGIQSYGAIGH